MSNEIHKMIKYYKFKETKRLYKVICSSDVEMYEKIYCFRMDYKSKFAWIPDFYTHGRSFLSEFNSDNELSEEEMDIEVAKLKMLLELKK